MRRKEREIIRYREYNEGDIHLTLGAYKGKLCLCDWHESVKFDGGVRKLMRELRGLLEEEPADDRDPVLDMAEAQLKEYFAGKRREFSVPLLIVGSDFHRQAMEYLKSIPYGEVRTYKMMAEKLLSGGRVSQCIGSCIGSNILSIFVPCHRVISESFTNGGYRGGLIVKQKLLRMENPETFQ